MAGFDDPGLFYADRFFEEDGDQNLPVKDDDLRVAKQSFRRFLREFNRGRMDFNYRSVVDR